MTSPGDGDRCPSTPAAQMPERRTGPAFLLNVVDSSHGFVTLGIPGLFAALVVVLGTALAIGRTVLASRKRRSTRA